MSVRKVRYGSFNLVIEIRGAEFIAHVERALSRDRVGDVVTAPSFEEAVMSARLEALRLSELA